MKFLVPKETFCELEKIEIIAKLKLFIDLTIIVTSYNIHIFFVTNELIKTVIILRVKFLAPSWITF